MFMVTCMKMNQNYFLEREELSEHSQHTGSSRAHE